MSISVVVSLFYNLYFASTSVIIYLVLARVAQRIRAMGFYPTGRGFDSLRGYQI